MLVLRDFLHMDSMSNRCQTRRLLFAKIAGMMHLAVSA